MVFEPLDFLARPAVLVPPPRVNLTRFHVVFAPKGALRARVVPSGRGKGARGSVTALEEERPVPHRAMTWVQRLKRVFKIDIERCPGCGGRLRVIACIEDAAVIQKILAHLERGAADTEQARLPVGRGPPQEDAVQRQLRRGLGFC